MKAVIDMIQNKDAPTVTHGFLVAVEADSTIEPSTIAAKLVDALMWVEGAGQTDVDYMGEFIDELPPETD